MREDYSRQQQLRIEKYYDQLRSGANHEQPCECKLCYEEWEWSTGFETMNSEGRARARKRDAQLGDTK